MSTDLADRLKQSAEREAMLSQLPPKRTFTITRWDDTAQEIVEAHALSYTDNGLLAFSSYTVIEANGQAVLTSYVTYVAAPGTWSKVVEIDQLRGADAHGIN